MRHTFGLWLVDLSSLQVHRRHRLHMNREHLASGCGATSNTLAERPQKHHQKDSCTSLVHAFVCACLTPWCGHITARRLVLLATASKHGRLRQWQRTAAVPLPVAHSHCQRWPNSRHAVRRICLGPAGYTVAEL